MWIILTLSIYFIYLPNLQILMADRSQPVPKKVTIILGFLIFLFVDDVFLFHALLNIGNYFFEFGFQFAILLSFQVFMRLVFRMFVGRCLMMFFGELRVIAISDVVIILFHFQMLYEKSISPQTCPINRKFW